MTEAVDPQATSGLAAFRHLSAADTWDLLLLLGEAPEPVLVLDVRDGPSFARSHLEGAVHFDPTQLPTLLRDAPKAANVIVYCYHGHASQAVATLFGSSGFANVFSVDGGFEALVREHARRRSPERENGSRQAPVPARRYIVGDCVYAREAIHNDGGVPELASDAQLAEAGARGVVVQVGHTEADPEQTLYAVRFEDAGGQLGPMVGCLPEELSPERPGE